MNQDNNYNFDPMTGQPINQQPQQPIQSTMNTYQQPVQPQQPKKKVNSKKY